ncbi:hypothetical protein D9619_006272 [Psilocybe cf. subviscida]|uniref:Actin interacting protein 3 C-terminal domain-containing protein n=1 Tax=Psilocybe cf. subviscida TaxID=2480587 RepID=A0A8H5EXM4_9AGAR|nr:hypothetical protein D9619_006272 [Psilocybe cf. subviscida]
MSRSGQSASSHSRRDNASISSTASGSGRTDRGSTRQTSPAVESAVTRLLVSIKQLLEALTLWSQLRMDEEGVSNVYVRLGNDFNAAVSAFAVYNIDMQELSTVPEDLRTVLEQCLAEDATPEHLELYLPTVRQIITNLLQGLRGKQSIYRRIVSDQRHRSGEVGHERTESSSRSSRTSGTSRRDGHRSQPSQQVADADGAPAVPTDSSSLSRRSGASSRRRDALSQATASSGGDFVGGFAPTLVEHPTGQQEDGSERARSPVNLQQGSGSGMRPPIAQTKSQSSFQSEVQDRPRSGTPGADTPKSPPVVPAEVKRYSLVDKPVERTSPPVIVEPDSPQDYVNGSTSPPPPDTPPIDPPPAVAQSLAALKSNDVLLERRASKRFSTYNISKMTGPMTRGSSLRNNSNHPNRRSLQAATDNLTAHELTVLTEADEEEGGGTEVADPVERAKDKLTRSTTPKRPAYVSPLPTTPSKTPEPTPMTAESVSSSDDRTAVDPGRITIFLQLGREVKKVQVEPGISFASMRVLFVDKFSYNPGLDNFPAIYIRDPSSGIQYELEDNDDIKEKCLLSLNIEPLDQIKQHIDAQISNLSNDIKELRSAVTTSSNHHQSAHLGDMTAQPMAESTPAAVRPSDRQFAHVARRLSRFIGDSPPSFFAGQQPPMPNMSMIQSQMTGQSLQAQMTGGSVLSEYTSRVVTDLKTQFDEVQNLRRDLAIMRQLYTDFMKSTKESLGTLRNQTQSVKQLANSNVGGARAYIDSGKKKLDTRSQNVLTEVEKLQDIIESVKDDVIKRHVTPNNLYFKNIKKDMDAVAAELGSLSEHINTVKPMWKKTWEEELQNIVEEQQFLTHQEEFLSDLQEDYKAMVEVYGHVEKVITLRKPNGAGKRPTNRSFRPPPRDEGHDGLSTVMIEIKGAQVDPERRLKAIEANLKNREKDLATRTDEMHMEIQDVVSQKKLKMTGGAEEVERVRQKRNEQTIKAMFGGGDPNAVGSFGVIEDDDEPMTP